MPILYDNVKIKMKWNLFFPLKYVIRYEVRCKVGIATNFSILIARNLAIRPLYEFYFSVFIQSLLNFVESMFILNEKVPKLGSECLHINTNSAPLIMLNIYNLRITLFLSENLNNGTQNLKKESTTYLVLCLVDNLDNSMLDPPPAPILIPSRCRSLVPPTPLSPRARLSSSCAEPYPWSLTWTIS